MKYKVKGLILLLGVLSVFVQFAGTKHKIEPPIKDNTEIVSV